MLKCLSFSKRLKSNYYFFKLNIHFPLNRIYNTVNYSIILIPITCIAQIFPDNDPVRNGYFEQSLILTKLWLC